MLGILIYCLFINYLEPLENQVSNRAIYPEIKDIPYREFSDDEDQCPFLKGTTSCAGHVAPLSGITVPDFYCYDKVGRVCNSVNEVDCKQNKDYVWCQGAELKKPNSRKGDEYPGIPISSENQVEDQPNGSIQLVNVHDEHIRVFICSTKNDPLEYTKVD